MRLIIQRVSEASVSVDQKIVSQISSGMLILLGVEEADNTPDIEWLTNKISQLRIFQDENDKMNLSIDEVSGHVIVVSQFTLHASTKKGNRPSFIKAARPEKAEKLYVEFCNVLESKIKGYVKRGVFGAMMNVELVNDGPVTIFIDSKNKE